MSRPLSTMRRLAGRLGVAWMLVAGSALGADRFVATTGDDAGNDCLSSLAPCATIGAAVAQAASADTVKVAAGTYRENLVLDASIQLGIEGGWSADFTTRDPALNRTTVDGRRLGRVFDLAAGAGETLDVTLDGLSIVRGLEAQGAAVNGTTAADGVLAITVSNCVLERNYASAAPAVWALSVPPASLQLSVVDSIIRKNRGGGVDVHGAVDALFEGSTFERNRQGSTMFLRPEGGAVTVSGCTFDRNTTPGSGSALFLDASGAADLTITASTFTRNRGAGAGVLLNALGGTATVQVTNSVFRANRARQYFPGGIWAGANLGGTMDLEVTNSTVVRNPGGGMDLRPEDGTLTVTLSNNILWDNDAHFALDLQLSLIGGSLTVDADHNVIGVRNGVGTYNDLGGNLAVDPLLASRIDVHLTAASPAVDAGTCTGAPATDFEGDPRPSGLGCDIGADERVP